MQRLKEYLSQVFELVSVPVILFSKLSARSRTSSEGIFKQKFIAGLSQEAGCANLGVWASLPG